MKDFFLQPAASLFAGLVRLRNQAYQSQLKKKWRLPCPVISVGNLTVGGTGKTPVIIELLRALEDKGIQAGVISRGYKSEVRGVAEVLAEASTYFGDEPLLVKSKFPLVPFFVSPNRVEAGRALLQKYPATQLILADDAFQHQRLERDLDIVLIDSTQPRSHYRMLPAGRAREPFASLERADVVLFTKSNISGAFSREEILGWMRDEGFQLRDQLLMDAEVHLRAPVHFRTGESLASEENWSLVSAIGNPEAFEKSVKGELALNVSQHLRLADHFEYSEEFVQNHLKADKRWLTTEKDMVKLEKLVPAGMDLYVAKLNVSFAEGEGELFEKVNRLLL